MHSSIRVWVAVVSFIGGLILGLHWRNTPEIKTEITERIIFDTIRDSIPKPLLLKTQETKYVYIKIADEETDVEEQITISQDSTHVSIPISTVQYKTPTYYAIVSGYKPKLEYIETYHETHYVDRNTVQYIKSKPTFGIGIQVGYGISREGMTPYIGIGLTYNIITFGNRRQ